jgi:hypothetical protein
VSPDAYSPAERANAVLRAAEAAAAAAGAPVQEPAAPPPPTPAANEARAPAALLAATGELEAHLSRARAQLDALDDALDRLVRGQREH